MYPISQILSAFAFAQTTDGALNAVWIALIVGVGSLASPALMAWLTNRNLAKVKAADYEREDMVADKAEKAAQALIETQEKISRQAEEAARLLADTNSNLTKTAGETAGKLDAIHTLVNSQMTAAIQSELDATIRELAMMNEVIELKSAQGREPNVETLSALQATKDKIIERQLTLAERHKQDKIAQEQMIQARTEKVNL